MSKFLKKEYILFRDIQMIEAHPLDCYGDTETGAITNYWQHGLSILNMMRVIKRIPGLSREIEFDTYGRRTKFGGTTDARRRERSVPSRDATGLLKFC